MNMKSFQAKVLTYYTQNGRHDLPWRRTKNPYRILVSEVMLQQTQVARVIPKYTEFLKVFPTIQALAEASNIQVVRIWSGLGYNRRALFLKRAAEAIVQEHKGIFPKDVTTLEALPGVGSYTARAVVIFAYNQPEVCIETNIRSAFIHEFFPKKKVVTDAKILPLIGQALDTKNPRQWYWALMDYGAYIKQTIGNPSRKSAHHTKQSLFKGSVRQIRGEIMRQCLSQGFVTKKEIVKKYNDASDAAVTSAEKIQSAFDSLVRDKTLIQKKNIFVIREK